MTIDAIVFDLDDTLLDTSGLLLEPAHREACQAMISAGLDVTLDRLLATREQLHRQHPREDLDTLLCAHFGQDEPAIAQAGRKAFYQRPIPDLPVSRDLLAMLDRLSDRCTLLLVTSGDPVTQSEKIRQMRIGNRFQNLVYVPLGQSKRDALEELIGEHQLEPARTLVVGDRVDSEIAAARRLGMRTVRVRGGEYGHLRPTSAEEQADWEVDSVLDLEQFMEKTGDEADAP